MIYKHFRYLFLIMGLLSSHNAIYSKILLPGNSDGHQSFTFNIGAHALYAPSAFFYVGSKEAGSAKDYALSFAAKNTNTGELRFFPIAPQKIVLNLSKDAGGNLITKDNPLYGARINIIKTFGSNLLITQATMPATVYFLENFTGSAPAHLFSSPVFNDANGLVTKDILSVETQTAQAIGSPSERDDAPKGFFAAVTNQDNTFNGNGAGISYAFIKDLRQQDLIVVTDAQADPKLFEPKKIEKGETEGEEKKSSNSSKVSNDNSKSSDDKTKSIDMTEAKINDGNRARAINLSENALRMGTDLLAIERSVALRWDSLLQRLYVGLQVQASQGARGILLASLVNGVINFQKIAPDSAFSSDNHIVGTATPGSSVSIHALKTIQTSTYLTYLVVHGGNGTPEETRNKVYALPLVQFHQAEDGRYGMLANVRTIPIPVISTQQAQRFQGRVFTEPAIGPSDLYTENSLAAQVGGGPAPAAIIDMVAFKDTVFIATQDIGLNAEPGIFYSQALFDDAARIKGWTAWQRAGSTGSMAGFNFGDVTGDFYTIPVINNGTHSGFVTSWNNGSALENLVHEEFPKDIYGVQGIYDFSHETSGFSSAIGSRIAVTVLTGYKKIMLLQTGADQAGIFTATSDYAASLFKNPQGTLDDFTSARALSISGGELDALKAIVSAEFVTDGANGWWVVGGAGGIAILSRSNGTGILEPSGLQAGFAGLASDMSFIKISSPKFVRKLLSFGNNLFVLTPTTLERITITPEAIATNNFNRVVLAKTKEVTNSFTRGSSSFADMSISGPLALIATSIGLFRSGNGVDIQIANGIEHAHWTLVQLNEATGSFATDERIALGPITQLLPISPTGKSKEWYANDRGIAGNMYVLNADIGYHQAQVYRLNFNDGPVTNLSVVPFPDFFLSGIKSFFVNLTDYRNGIQTDGSVFFVTRSAYEQNAPFISILSSALRSSQVNGGGVRSTRTMLREDTYNSIGRIIRLNALGCWAVNGDFGIRLHN